MHFLKKETSIIVGEMIEGSCLIFKVRNNKIIKGLFTAKGDEIWPENGYFGSFNCGLCPIETKSGYGYINRQEEMVIEPKYLIADDFSENRAWTSAGDKNILINNDGYEIRSWGNDYIPNDFSEGVARIIELGAGASNYKTGYINTDGDLIIPFMEESPFVSLEDLDNKDEYCSDGLIRYNVKNKYGFIDKSLNLVIPFLYKDALKFQNGLAIVIKEDDWGYINKANDFISLAEFQSASPFYNGKAIVFDTDKSMAINRIREVIREFDVDFVSYKIKGHYIIKRNEKLGLMDHDFNEISPPVFDQIEKFEEGILHYSNEGKDGVCNLDGEYIEVNI